jgi:hypothetical protein
MHGAILQFYYLSMYQHEPEVRSASLKLLLETFRKRFNRIALNEYMDHVLGIDDSKVHDNYDSNE